MEIKIAARLTQLPPYLFVEVDRAKKKARAEGKDVIDFGIGDPDKPTPSHIIDALNKAVRDSANHRYALDQGMPALRNAIAGWYKKRFNVDLSPENEILPLIGSKEGIAHLPLGIINPGDYSLVPDPCYPPYRGGTILAGGRVYSLPLLEQNDFLPDFSRVPSRVLNKAKLMYMNYPNNPTSATAGKPFYRKVVDFAQRNNIIVVSDLAYSEIYYDNVKIPSFLEIDGARNVGVEFHSLSKSYNMTGWRIGWVCGNKDVIAALRKVKSNMDSGIFIPVQFAGVAALSSAESISDKMRKLYQDRRDVLVEGLRSLGWQIEKPKATFYLWVKIPGSYLKNKRLNSISFAQMLLDETGIVVTPGVGFGKSGEGYIRFALTIGQERITQAIKRLKA